MSCSLLTEYEYSSLTSDANVLVHLARRRASGLRPTCTLDNLPSSAKKNGGKASVDMFRLPGPKVEMIRLVLPMSVLFAFASKNRRRPAGFKDRGGGVASGYIVPTSGANSTAVTFRAQCLFRSLFGLPDRPMSDGEGGNILLHGCSHFQG